MALISVSPEELIAKTKTYTQAKAGIEAEIQKINSMNSELQQFWKGKAFEAYLSQYQQLYIQVKKFEDLLDGINQQITQYAQTIQQRDAEDARSFGL